MHAFLPVALLTDKLFQYIMYSQGKYGYLLGSTYELEYGVLRNCQSNRAICLVLFLPRAFMNMFSLS